MVDIKIVDTGAPKGGPYSPGLIAGNLIFVSGQVPVGSDGKVPTSIEEQTAVTLGNLKAIIEKAGAKVANIVRCTVFMTNIAEFTRMNDAYTKFFDANGAKDRKPTRTTVEITKLAKEGARIEIDCIAML
ncbi:MAG: RidA family protein [Candidatus Sigynarchaeota archaeon]